MDTIVISLTTPRESAVVDLTGHAADFVAGKGSGLLHVFAPHATAGLALIETGAGSDDDLLDALGELFGGGDWRHRHGSAGHGADHVIPAFIAPSLVVPVVEGALALGTWQSVVLVDPNRDNASRQVRLSFLPG